MNRIYFRSALAVLLASVAFIVLSFVLGSCQIVGLYDGYKSLPDEYKRRVAFSERPEERRGNGEKPVVTMTTAEHLLSQFDPVGYNLLYDFVPNCPSRACIPISLFVKETRKVAGVTPWVLVAYLDPYLFSKPMPVDLYGMDGKSYGSKFVFKVGRRFFRDLTKGDEADKARGNLLLFKGTTYLETLEDISELEDAVARLNAKDRAH